MPKEVTLTVNSLTGWQRNRYLAAKKLARGVNWHIGLLLSRHFIYASGKCITLGKGEHPDCDEESHQYQLGDNGIDKFQHQKKRKYR